MGFPCCSPLIRWSISWLCRSWGAGREESVEIPQLLLVVGMPVGVQQQMLGAHRSWLGQAQGQGLTRAEKGWRGRRESRLPSVLPPELIACSLACMERHMSENIVCTTTTTTKLSV